MTGGSIDRALWEPKPTPRESLSWQTRVQWASDIAEGMAFIHSRGYTHRDLKSKNVLYDKDTMRAKVADFGMSVSVEDAPPNRISSSGVHTSLLSDVGAAPVQPKFMTAQCGTPRWMAPELASPALKAYQKAEAIFSHERHSRAEAQAKESYWQFQADNSLVQYTQMVDVYAFAITMFEICTHSPPWEETEAEDEVFAKVVAHQRPTLNGDVKAESPTGWVELMHVCWDRQPSLRPTFNEICKRLRTMCHLVKDRKAMGQESYDLRVVSPRGSSGTPRFQSLPVPTRSIESSRKKPRYKSGEPFQQHRVGSLEEHLI